MLKCWGLELPVAMVAFHELWTSDAFSAAWLPPCTWCGAWGTEEFMLCLCITFSCWQALCSSITDEVSVHSLARTPSDNSLHLLLGVGLRGLQGRLISLRAHLHWWSLFPWMLLVTLCQYFFPSLPFYAVFALYLWSLF